MEKQLPSGSGVDCGTKIILESCTPRKIVLGFEFHHMDSDGLYDGWTSHHAVIVPDWNGFSITILGRDKNQIKDYLHDLYHDALMAEFEN